MPRIRDSVVLSKRPFRAVPDTAKRAAQATERALKEVDREAYAVALLRRVRRELQLHDEEYHHLTSPGVLTDIDAFLKGK